MTTSFVTFHRNGQQLHTSKVNGFRFVSFGRPVGTHALSIREPYAWLIAAGFKLAEIRSFPFPKKFAEPTWIAMHASLSRQEIGDVELSDYLVGLDGELAGILEDEKWFDKDKRLFGHSEIIGAMRINHSILASDDATDEQWDRWAEVMENRSERCTTGISPEEFLCDDMHNWIIDDCYRFATPIVCPGRLNVWSLGDELEALVNVEFQRALQTGGIGRDDPLGKPIIHQMPKSACKKFYETYSASNAK